MRYGKVCSNLSTYSRSDGGTIGEVNEVRDLGILMANSATFDSEIDKIILKSNRQAKPAGCFECSRREKNF